MTALNPILILLATVLVVYWEGAFGGIRHLLGAQVDLLPALIVYVSLSSSLFVLTGVAVLGGGCFDALSANPLGVTTVPLLTSGLLIYAKRDLILRDQPFAQFILGLVASASVPIVSVLLMMSKGETPLLSWASLWQWMVMSIGGGIAAPVFFQIFELLDRTLNYRRVTESSFRSDREIRRGR